MLQITAFLRLTPFAGTMQKHRKCCKQQCFFRLEMHKTLQIPVFLEAMQKNSAVNYSIFGKLIAHNAGIYTVFGMSRKRGRREPL